MAVKRVKFYCEYLIEDAVDDEDALDKADKKLNDDINTGWFCLDNYEIEDVEQEKKPTPHFQRRASERLARYSSIPHLPPICQAKSAGKFAQIFIPKFVQFFYKKLLAIW